MTTQSFLGLAPVEDKKVEFLKTLTTEKGRNIPFGEILAELRSSGSSQAQSMIEAFEHVTASEVRAAFSVDPKEKVKTKGKKNSKGADIPALKNAKDPAERAAYRDQILALIVEKGLTESGRGQTPLEMRTALQRGNENQARDILTELVEQGLIVSTGKTKGLRYVAVALARQAQAKADEEAAAKKAKQDKDVAE